MIVEGSGAWTPRAEGGAALMWQVRIQVLLAAGRRLRVRVAQFRLHSCNIRPAINFSVGVDRGTGGDVVAIAISLNWSGDNIGFQRVAPTIFGSINIDRGVECVNAVALARANSSLFAGSCGLCCNIPPWLCVMRSPECLCTKAAM